MNLFSSLFKGDDNMGLLPTGTTIVINKKNVKIIEKIGEGGFATVYSAKDNERKYAVKHCKCQSTEQIELIDNEIEIMQKCATSDHPNIVNYYGNSQKIFEARDMMPRRIEYFILLEFMDSSLISFIKKHQQQNRYLQEKELFELFLDINNAVFLLHSQTPPIAHRDIKIDNVLIKNLRNNKVRLKLCDFGSCVDGTPRKCETTQQINIESELIERFTTPSYRSPEMIDLYQRKELSTKVDVWALGCILFLLAFYEHPFPEGGKMQILGVKYKFPEKHKYSKKVTKLIKMCLHKDPVRRPTAQQISEHLTDLLCGGKGTLSTKKKHRSLSNADQQKQGNKLMPKNNEENRRKSMMTGKPPVEEAKSNFNSIKEEEWDPFDSAGDDNNPFDDDFTDHTFKIANKLKPKEVSSQDGKTSTLLNIDESKNDPFFSDDFAKDFFVSNDANNNNNNNANDGRRKSASSTNSKKRRKSNNIPKPIDAEVYNEHQRQSKRRNKKNKPTRSRSKSPLSSTKSNKKTNKNHHKPPATPPPPQPQKPKQDANILYADQLAQLVSMGFEDTNKNLKAIVRGKGNVQVAVSILISQ